MPTHQPKNKSRLMIFGEELSKTRRHKGLTQLDVAYMLELGGTAPLVEWEKGRRRPQINTLIKIAHVLGIPYSQEVYWRGLTGYLPQTDMPNKEQIQKGLAPYIHHLADYPYPAYILDNRLQY